MNVRQDIYQSIIIAFTIYDTERRRRRHYIVGRFSQITLAKQLAYSSIYQKENIVSCQQMVNIRLLVEVHLLGLFSVLNLCPSFILWI